jgi:SAM-dependent methyltransferase
MRDRGHRGALIGVDIIHEQDLEEGAFSLSSFYPEIVAARVNFLSGKSPELPLADNSVDVLLAKFMIYHVPNPSEALADFQRVLKPGGKLVIATSGPTNKIKHRQFEQRIADFLAKEWGRPVNPPTRFAAPFDTVVAEKLLPEYFDIKSHRAHRSKLRIKDEEGVFVYLRSLLSMKDSFRPIPHGSEVERAIGHKVLPEIFEDIADPKRGHFSDSIDRHYYICENTKKTAAGSALETSE